MPSTLLTAKATIITVIEALTPPDETARPYRHLDNERYLPQGSSGHRSFWFEALKMAEQLHVDTAIAEYRHEFKMFVRLSSAGYNVATAFDSVVNEAVLISRAINKRATSWGSGVNLVQCESVDITEDDGEDFILEFALVCECSETL